MRSRLQLAFFVLVAAAFALVAAPGLAAADEPTVVTTAQANAQIDINTASASELTTLKGIGKKKAQAIVDYRTANGPFESVDDITNVKGIGAKTLAKLRDQMTVGDGETAAAAPPPTRDASADDVPAETPPARGTTPTKAPAKAAGGLIDINTASAAELQTLTGIGEGKAAKIIEYRKSNGPFKSVDDLTKVKGIGAKTVAKFRDQITAGQAE